MKHSQRQIALIVHDIRSSHNVGSLLRTAEGLGVEKVYLTGYTPYPARASDTRLPHLAAKQTRQIAKTALGAEKLAFWEHHQDINTVLNNLTDRGYIITGLEQDQRSIPLPDYNAPQKIALLLGSEVDGIDPKLRKICSDLVEIPMFGSKESFNVAQAAAMTLYHLRFK